MLDPVFLINLNAARESKSAYESENKLTNFDTTSSCLILVCIFVIKNLIFVQ